MALVAQHLCNQERQLKRLPGVQTRIHLGFIATRQVDIRDVLGTTQAFSDILTGQLNMNSAGVRAQGTVNLEEALDFINDFVEVTRLVAVR